jgi:acyl transferase domain-containing protein/NADPH:quinone reductase-like Zn-dependent oxidoreductase
VATDAVGRGAAVIGTACRLPGARDLDAFWELLLHGRDAISEVPRERFDVDAFYTSEAGLPGRMTTRWGGFLDNVDGFDAPFFRITPREAASVDPQQRLLLELAWESIEDAGLDPERLAGRRVGVFVGISTNDYGLLMVRDTRAIDAFTGTGGSLSIAANRISYCLDLRGPSLAVDTACSSALVALHLAVQSLRRGECEMALVGGVNVILTPDKAIGYSHARMMAADGRCKTFDARADGFVRGEGGAMVLLQPLAVAALDGAPIRGVIRGSAVNQDGLTNGLSAPNGASQRAVIREALADAAVAADEIGYLEAHGTGTPMGDPIEMEAILAELGHARALDRPCLVGSVKTNIGHLEAASGAAALVKVLLSLDREIVPPHLHLQSLNPRIDLEGRPFTIPTEPRPWPRAARPRYAGLSAFGFGGTNAHVVVEESPPLTTVSRPARSSELLTLRAASAPALKATAGRYAAFLQKTPVEELGDVCATANAGRAELPHRLAVVASTPEDAAQALQTFAEGGDAPSVMSGRARRPAPRIGFLFTGQGSQYVGMGRELFDVEPVFRKAIERAGAVLEPDLDRPLVDVLFTPGSPLDETACAQPALFALEHALVELLASWGIRPAALLGHSVGEYTAACAAGVFEWEAGLRWIAERGRLMQALPRDGEMVAVDAGEDEVLEAIAAVRGEVSLAAVNGPRRMVVSGRRDAVAAVRARFETAGRSTRRLEVSHAFHSPLMDAVLEPFARSADRIRFCPPRVPIVCDTTGDVGGAIASAAYWTRHLREPVRFADAVRSFLALGLDAIVEIGPRPVLLPLARESAGAAATTPALWLPTLRPGRSDWRQLLDGVGALHVAGTAVSWAALDGPCAGRRVRLPTYPFQRQRSWLKPASPVVPEAPLLLSATAGHPLLGQRLPSAAPETQLFLARLAPGQPSWLSHHVVHGLAVVPAAALLDMAFSAGAELLHTDRLVLTDVVFRRPLRPARSGETWVQLVWDAREEGGARFRIFSREASSERSEWILHATGAIARFEDPLVAPAEDDGARGPEADVDVFYETCGQHGLEYGRVFRGVARLWRGRQEACADVSLPAEAGTMTAHFVPPPLLDACFQVLGAAAEDEAGTFVPARIERVAIQGRPGAAARCQARLQAARGAAERSGDLRVQDAAGAARIEVDGFVLARLEGPEARARNTGGSAELLYEIAWQPAPSLAAGDARQGETWIVLDDADGLAASLATELRAAGGRVVCVARGAADDLARVIAAHTPCAGVVCLGAARPPFALPSDDTPASAEEGLRDALHAAQAVLRADASPRFFLVTRGAQTVDGAHFPGALAQAAVWGLGRTIAREHPELRCTLVDLDPLEPAADAARRLRDEILAAEDEDQVVLRPSGRSVPRLVRCPPVRIESESGNGPFLLRTSRYGDLDALHKAPAERRPPGPGEIEIEVRAAGLNLRDVLGALGMMKELAPALGIRSEADLRFGFECAGTVKAAGASAAFRPGDDVVALALGSLGSHVRVDARLAVRKPASQSFEQAASVPVAALTGLYALRRLAGLRRGESVLVHSAAGGVGLAAVQLGLAAGATVFATASRPKWDLLRSMGVEHVMSSRTLAFADEIRDRTNGRGVDVVLNSLGGDSIAKSVAALDARGRFVEIGKLGIWDAARFHAARPDAAYHVFDLGEEARREPALIASLFEEMTAALADGSLSSLTTRVFSIDEAPAAFRAMAQARHTGKIVFRMNVPSRDRRLALRSDATYLVTGGLGGLGLAVASWLCEKGARHVALLGRRAPNPAAQSAIAALEAQGAQVRVLEADVADRAALQRAMAALETSSAPLRGVVHAAGVLDDARLEEQSGPRLEAVLAPKMRGAWNLDALTRGTPLDFFVCFSSAAALMGSRGQAGYAAANAFLDAFAHHRRSRGLPALTIDFGPWADVGMAAALPERERARLAASGISSLAPGEALAALGEALEREAAQVAVLRLDAERLRAGSAPLPPLLRDGVVPPAASGGNGGAGPDVRDRIAKGGVVSADAVLAYLRHETGRVLGLAPGQLPDVDAALTELGLESFTAFELKAAIQAGLGIEIPTKRLFDGTNLTGLARLLAEQLTRSAAPPTAPRERVP